MSRPIELSLRHKTRTDETRYTTNYLTLFIMAPFDSISCLESVSYSMSVGTIGYNRTTAAEQIVNFGMFKYKIVLLLVLKLKDVSRIGQALNNL